MKKFFFFILFAALSLTMVAQQKKVAVYVTGDDAGINKVLSSKLSYAIGRDEKFSLIERTDAFLAAISKEQSYERTGSVDDEEISRIGKQFGVQYICVAAVTDAFNEKYLSARLINVETAQVERTASSSGAIQSLDGIVNAANSVSKELLTSLGNDGQSNSKKVAVYIIKNEAGKNVGRVLGDKLVAGFTNSGRYIAIERTNSFLAQLNKEQNYQRTESVDDSELSRLGKQFGVQYVCVADVSDVFGEKFVAARLIDVETAEVVNAYDVGGVMNDMSSCLKMANEIAENLSIGTFEEQAEAARLKAEEEERIRKTEEEEAKRKAKEEEFAKTSQRFAQSIIGLVDAIQGNANSSTSDNQNQVYFITISNYKNSTFKIHFGNYILGYVQGGRVETFTVPRNVFGTLTATQTNGYLLYPTVMNYTITQQTRQGNIGLYIK